MPSESMHFDLRTIGFSRFTFMPAVLNTSDRTTPLKSTIVAPSGVWKELQRAFWNRASKALPTVGSVAGERVGLDKFHGRVGRIGWLGGAGNGGFRGSNRLPPGRFRILIPEPEDADGRDDDEDLDHP